MLFARMKKFYSNKLSNLHVLYILMIPRAIIENMNWILNISVNPGVALWL